MINRISKNLLLLLAVVLMQISGAARSIESYTEVGWNSQSSITECHIFGDENLDLTIGITIVDRCKLFPDQKFLIKDIEEADDNTPQIGSVLQAFSSSFNFRSKFDVLASRKKANFWTGDVLISRPPLYLLTQVFLI